LTDASFLFLSQEDVVAAGGLDMGPTIDVVEEALRLYADGDAVLPPKVSIHWGKDIDSEERDGRIMAMPAYVGGEMDVAGLKWIPSVPDNPARGLPRGIGMILLSDRTTGLPVALLDGTIVSAMRTGAVGGICAKLFANARSRLVTMLGAGVQATTQLKALELVLLLDEVRVWDIDPDRARLFCEREARDDFSLLPVADPAEACRDADLIVAATMASEPYVPPAWVGPGTTFLSMSSLDPTLDLIRAADVLVVDVWQHDIEHPSRPFARALAAGFVTREDVFELGEVLSGSKPGRTDASQRVFVSPVGLGIEDVAAAWRIVRRADELGIGTPLRLWERPIWT
jgi:N-[(2S)-2-amino-2-carboxyethyl]-L-glutamate dehydrogenase